MDTTRPAPLDHAETTNGAPHTHRVKQHHPSHPPISPPMGDSGSTAHRLHTTRQFDVQARSAHEPAAGPTPPLPPAPPTPTRPSTRPPTAPPPPPSAPHATPAAHSPPTYAPAATRRLPR
eukprot:TRINITY_DN11152_c0_g1_i1.p3 TRINITY_DN11152_c0_g1~~TRINITY_DN11152_c0_g1_i1.p3  ORF type:complete len:120 (+),score=11.54 TRINITY_DN11152_c0_g1_i1:462-821(+)